MPYKNRKASSRVYYLAHRDEIRKRSRAYHQNNRDSVLRKMRQYGKLYYLTNKDKQNANSRRIHLLAACRLAGITVEEFERMADKQGYVCAICHQKPNCRLAVDHCHKSGAFRGLLCRACNTGLGYFKDNRESLASAIEYLSR